ncbi:MAG: hypothetical protein N3D10_04255, partial [Candidatus Micrarchaeota archaeon]|nr:hypothetical protein [Candidatus Micrarchaeota archaeon]
MIFSLKHFINIFLFFVVFLVFSLNISFCKVGTDHIKDFQNVFEGLSGGQLDELQKTITSKIIDAAPDSSFLDGFTCGNHRWFGHWGFEGNIPFNKPPLSECLQQLPPEKKELIKQKIRNEWTKRVKDIQILTEKITGLPPKQAKAFAGLLYNTHLLGDWGHNKAEIRSLSDINAIKKDIEKNLHRLFGNNSEFAKQVINELKKIKTKNPQKAAQQILNILKDFEIGKELWRLYGKTLAKKGITYNEIKATAEFLAKALGRNFKVSKDGNKQKKPPKEVKARPGLLTSNGKLLVSLKEGGIAGLAVFAFEGGEAYYQLIKGNILTAEFRRKIEDAAIKGSVIAG